MKCPFCSEIDTQVKDSRISDDGVSVKRRRFCAACGSRFTTFERVQMREIIVIKKNGERKLFDPEKLKRSIETAVRKRMISEVQLDKIVNNIIRQIEIEGETEVSSSKIGDMAMSALEKIDKIAFIRFASVYKNFETIEDFKKFIE